jgi:hypothetical protein
MSQFINYASSGVYIVDPTPSGEAGQKLNGNFKALVDRDASQVTALTNHESATAVHGATSANTSSRIVARDAGGGFSAGELDVQSLRFDYNRVVKINEWQIQVLGHLSVSELFAVGGVATSAYSAQIYGTLGVTSSVTAARFIGEGTTPTGSMLLFGGATAPAGWLLCDGSTISRTTYAALFDVIGEAYGTGDGSTTFQLPDLRARFPLGADGSSWLIGQMGGSLVPTIATSSQNVAAGTDYAALVWAGSESSPPPYQVVNYIIKT